MYHIDNKCINIANSLDCVHKKDSLRGMTDTAAFGNVIF